MNERSRVGRSHRFSVVEGGSLTRARLVGYCVFCMFSLCTFESPFPDGRGAEAARPLPRLRRE